MTNEITDTPETIPVWRKTGSGRLKLLAAGIRFLDLPKLVFIIYLAAMAALLPLADSDYFWHLKTGEYILSHRQLPAADIFSYTQYGKPWELHEWLFEVMLYQARNLAGDWGVKFLTSLLATLALFFAYLAANHLSRNKTAALILLLATMAPFSMGISPRPQLVTYLFFSLYLYVLSSCKYFRETRQLFMLPLLMLFWVNFHGGYIVGIALLIVFTLCEWGNYALSGDSSAEKRNRLVLMSKYTLATVLSSLANPYFLHHWLYPFQVMGMNASKNFIGEWQSPDFHDPHTLSFLLLAGVFFTVSIYRRKKPDLTEFVLPAAFIAASFYSQRHIPLTALLLFVFSAGALAQKLETGALGQKLQFFYSRRLAGGKELGAIEYVMNWLLLAMAILGIWLYSFMNQAAEQKNLPAAAGAAQFILDSGLKGRMFNSYNFGGYLIYRLYPAQKVFIDGRADLYGDKFIENSYRVIANGQPDWQKALDAYRIDYVVNEHDSSLNAILLASSKFRLVYDDAGSSVLVRNIPPYAGIIAKYGK